MNPIFEIKSCAPDEPLFTAMLPRIYPSGVPQSVLQQPETDFLTQCWVVLADGEAVGRVGFYQNEEILYQDRATVQLGLFECMDNPEAAAVLFQTAQTEALQAGVGWMLGPLNGTTWNRYRFLTEKGTEPPFLGEPTHPEYYPQLWEKAGFVPVGNYLSNIAPLDPATEKDADFWYRNNLRVETVLPENLAQVLTDVYPMCTAAFEAAPFYSSISKAQFSEKLSAVAPLLQAGCTKVVYDASGETVAFALCYPDPLSQNRTILKTAARKKPTPVSGIIAALYREIAVPSLALGRDQLIHAFIHEANSSATRSGHFGGETMRRYTLYGKPL